MSPFLPLFSPNNLPLNRQKVECPLFSPQQISWIAGAGGAAVGGRMGPWGALFGGIIGAVTGENVAKADVEWRKEMIKEVEDYYHRNPNAVWPHPYQHKLMMMNAPITSG